MSLRSRAALLDRPGSTVAVAKTFGPGVPESFRQGEQQSQMTPSSPFSPGTPIGPYDGYDRVPRSRDFVTGYNIAARPRLHERVSFGTLKGLIEAYDVASLCIWHRIDSIRSLDWKLVSADHFDGDVTDMVPLGLAALYKPDRENYFDTWLARWLYDVLAYDAAPLYRLRTRGGRAVGLMPFDGTSLAPLLDYWGRSPAAPAPGEPEPEAYVQYANGLPWGWLTRSDVIYQPFRPHNDSIYGQAPIETIILNANTDLRFQVYFLQRFTAGNLPAAFASAPESWGPDQIEQFQVLWDSFMFEDQSRKHQVRWMPPGSKFVWSNEKDFSDQFSLFLMRKTAAAFHVVPADLGFTENVNRSSGESQADVQHRVGDLPLIRYIQRVISSFLQDDLGLPLKFAFDIGEEQDDRLAQAQADDIYIKNGTVSPSYIAEMRFGRTDARPVPRFIFTERSGPIPLNSLEAVAGEIDPATAAPALEAALPHQVFEEAPGVEPNPPLYGQPLAEEIYGPSAIPAHTETQSAQPVREPDEAGQVRKEMAAFRNYSRKRRQRGVWQDFGFRHVPAAEAALLNAEGKRTVVKAASGPDLSPGSGMISLDLPDGLIDPVQGGVTDHHVTIVYLGRDVDDEAFEAACLRAASAAAGMPGPLEAQVGGIGSFPPSDGSDGKMPVWAGVTMPGGEQLRSALADLSASEHPEWKPHVTLAYAEPGDPLPSPVPAVPVTFTHLSVHRGGDVARFRLGGEPGPAGCCGAECCTSEGGCCGGSAGCQCAASSDIAKAVVTGPKAWPGWELDLPAAGYWAPLLAAALSGALSRTRAEQIARAWLAEHPQDQPEQGRRETVEAAAAWLYAQGLDLVSPITPLMPGMIADAALIGGVSAAAAADGTPADTGDWQPGNQGAARDRAEALGLGAVLGAAQDRSDQDAQQAAGGYMTSLARVLADSASSGLGAAAAGAALLSALSDPEAAGRTVLGVLVTGIGAAALALYLARKVQRVAFTTALDARVCVTCSQYAAGSPYPIASAPQVPVHPACRCAIQPA
ncbi:MAG TPA: phage portal protein [Streptosporangiaceae bacterium]|nr:phage portal protein [Streptosporangiaceae bacterium]